MPLSTLTWLCNRPIHLQNFLSSQTATLSPLNTHSPFPSATPPQPPCHFLSLCVWLLWVPRISAVTRDWSSRDWPVSLSVMSSRFVWIVACVRISFFKAEYYSITCVAHISLVYSLPLWLLRMMPCKRGAQMGVCPYLALSSSGHISRRGATG